MLGLTRVAFAQQETSVAIEGHQIAVKYAPPSVKTRISASLHSDADLAFKGITVPKGDYMLYILADGAQWQLAVNKASGAKASTYDPKLDLGKVAMTMGKPSAPAEGCKIALTKTAALAAKIEVTWNGSVATAPFHLDRGAGDSEW
jgi:hypothetical protein